MTDRLLIDRKGVQYTAAYITDKVFILRLLYPITQSEVKGTLHEKAELLQEDSLINQDPTQLVQFSFDGGYWTLASECKILLDELYDTEWVPGANIRVWCPISGSSDYIGTYSSGIAYNILPYSYNSKHIPEFEKYIIKFQSSKDAVAHLMPLKRTDTFLTVPLQLAVSNAKLFTSNVEFNQTIDLVDSHNDNFWDEHAIKFEFDNGNPFIEAGGKKELTVRAFYMGIPMADFNETYIIDAIDGYAPRKRIEFKNGVGTVTVYALGLETGEQMRIKLNNSFYTSLTEIVLDVI